jgi:hypothetical protein
MKFASILARHLLGPIFTGFGLKLTSQLHPPAAPGESARRFQSLVSVGESHFVAFFFARRGFPAIFEADVRDLRLRRVASSFRSASTVGLLR